MDIAEFLKKYFTGTQGYNPVNSTVYGLVLVVLSYIVFKVIERLKIKPDKRLAIAVAPFVFLASSVRVMMDAGMLTGFPFSSPTIWFVMFGVTVLSFLVSIFIEKKTKIPYFKLMFVAGVLLTIKPLLSQNYTNFWGAGMVLLWMLPWVTILKISPWPTENKIITGFHMFDATTTFISMEHFGYIEQHPLPTFIINSFGTPFAFVIFKFIVIVAVLFILDKYSDDKELNKFIKIIIGALGALAGTRDFLRMFALT